MGKIRCQCGKILDDDQKGVFIHAYLPEHFNAIIESDEPQYLLRADWTIWRCPKCGRLYIWDETKKQKYATVYKIEEVPDGP